MRKILLSILFIVGSFVVMAQESVEDYYMYKIDEARYDDEIIESDTLLFYRAMQRSYDLFDEATAYHFSFVEYARRGVYYTERDATLDGIAMRRANISLLRRLGLSESGYAGVGLQRYKIGGMAGADEFTTADGMPLDRVNVGAFFSGKGYLGGVRAAVNRLMRRGWSLSLYLAGKGGDDLYVGGVYNNAIDAGLRLSKSFDSGSVLSVVAATTISERGMRSGSTQEVFTLRGDNLYNPTWGRQSGEVRNSRVRRDAVPFMVASYSTNIGQNTKMLLSAGGDYGHRRYSALGWYDALTPRPDNYRYLPSYFVGQDVAAEVETVWRSGDEHYIQINWDELYRQNYHSQDGAVYALEDRVERIARGEVLAHFRTDLGGDFAVNYSLRGRYNSTRNYKQMRDMLGASHLIDIDYYLVDDDTFSRKKQNDLRNPDRRITQGDRFGYDYELIDMSAMADVRFEYNSNRWHVSVGAEVGSARIKRKGYFEKELFPGGGSYGESNTIDFAPYTIKATLGYVLSPRHYIDFVGMVANRLPQTENMFLNPQYNNRIVDNPSMEGITSAEFNYKFTSPDVDVVATAYMSSTHSQIDSYRAYDDLSSTFTDVVVDGLGAMRYGVEAAAKLRFSENWRASLAASAGRYIYDKNPFVSHYDDADNTVISSRSESYLGSCFVGGAPQLCGVAELTYINYRGWVASCSLQAAAMRYVDPSFVRRTERVARQSSASEEIYRSFIEQQRLNDAVTVDVSVSRWFDFATSRLSLTLSVRNLLGKSDIVYGGYEQSRIRNYISGAQRIYSPQDDVLTYSYGRTFYAVVSWKFGR